MDPNSQVMEKSIDSNAQDEAGQSIDTSFAEEMVVENPTSSSVTHKDVEAIQALESTDILQTSVESNNDSKVSSTRVFPDVPFDSESSKENQIRNLFASRCWKRSYIKERMGVS